MQFSYLGSKSREIIANYRDFALLNYLSITSSPGGNLALSYRILPGLEELLKQSTCKGGEIVGGSESLGSHGDSRLKDLVRKG